MHDDFGVSGYRGTVERPKPLLTLNALAPWGATVEVTALELAGYRETQFEVATHWLGPPLHGTPPTDRPVHGNDAIILDELELAKAVAHRARDALASGQLPDLWELAGKVRRTPGS